MAYCVQDAPDGLALDTAHAITPELAQRIARTPLLGQKVRGVAQYVGLEGNGVFDVDTERLAGILRAGLGLWLVQHCLNPGWEASASLGRQLGAAARRNATLVGYQPGAHLALDLEGCASTGQPVVDYVIAWVDAVSPQFPPLLYVGYECGLTAQQLYEALPRVQLYWSDAGPRQVSRRGFALKQHATTVHCGIAVDPDTLQPDNLGARLRWMVSPQDLDTDPAVARLA